MRLVGRFVSRKANVAVDTGKIYPGPAGDVKAIVQAEDRGSKLFEEAAKRLHDGGLVALAVGVHPDFLVVLPEIAKEAESLLGNNGTRGRHGVTSGPDKWTDYTIPIAGQLHYAFWAPNENAALQKTLKSR